MPVDADAHVVDRLGELDFDIVACARNPGEPGDPTYLRLLAELDEGAVGFTCQGNLNGLAIEGGETLGYELVSQLASVGLGLDHVVVQVGGGALASSCVQAFAEARALGKLGRIPRVHTVQTAGAHPLERAFRQVHKDLAGNTDAGAADRAVRAAAGRRSAYMWPWEVEPRSVAEGILDDETYDWLAVVRGMLATHGEPVVVGEERLVWAHELGREAGFPVSATGSAGLAGLAQLVESGTVRRGERVGVLFTGVERS